MLFEELVPVNLSNAVATRFQGTQLWPMRVDRVLEIFALNGWGTLLPDKAVTTFSSIR
jgi:hypothetical protein